jgi:ubiquinone/menaquinone biosynthesis C-methylase UbiE
MRQKTIDQINEKLKSSYSAVAREFYLTRKTPWEEFHHFLGYVRHGAKVLDIGCGNGRFYDFLKPRKVEYYGIDHNSHQLEVGREMYPDARLELGDMMDLNLPENAFDNVFCIAAFHHIPGKKMRRKVADDFYRILKPDGVLILTVWNLFQLKYLVGIVKGFLSCILHLGLKTAWNDVWVRWGAYPIKRYYHAFLPKELIRYFDSGKWKIEEFYFTRKGNRVSFLRSFNIVLIARKV